MWTLSHHLCTTLTFKMFDENLDDNEITPIDGDHKEVGRKQTKLDASDRNILIKEIKKYRNPLHDQSEDPLTNIISGRVAPENVNVDDALQIGQKMSAEFLSGLPKGFYKPIKKKSLQWNQLREVLKWEVVMRMMQKKHMHVCLSFHRKGKLTFQDSSNMNLHQFRPHYLMTTVKCAKEQNLFC